MMLLFSAFLLVATPPNPLDIEPNFWTYFQEEGEKKERAEAFLAELARLKQSLTQEEHTRLVYLIDKIELNIKYFLEEENKEFQKKPTMVKFLEKYTLFDLLQINRNLAEASRLEACANEEIKRLQSLLRFHTKKIDEAHILYRNAPKESFARLLLGLQIMQDRSQVAIMRAQIRNYEARAGFYREEAEKLTKELETAKQRLVLTGYSLEEIEEKIRKLKAQRETIDFALLRIQKEVLQKKQHGIEGENLSQEELFYRTDSLVIESEILLHEVIEMFIKITSKDVDVSVADLRESLSRWRDEIDNIQVRLQLFEETIDRELAQIGRNITNVSLLESISEKEQDSIIRNLYKLLDDSIVNIQNVKLNMGDTRLLMGDLSYRLISERDVSETWFLILSQWFQDGVTTIKSTATTVAFSVDERPVTLGNIFQAAFALAAAFLIARFVKRGPFVKKKLSENLNLSTEYIILRTLNYFILLIGVFIALSYLGINFSNLFLVAGALGVGIGFGLQTIANNLISGFLILYQRNIKVGDIIEVDTNFLGRVEEINLQNSHIKTFDGIDVIIPNSILTSKMLANWTMQDYRRRLVISFEVAYGSDKEKVREAALLAASRVPCTIKGDKTLSDPQVWLTDFAHSGIKYQLVVWINSLIPTKTTNPRPSYTWELESALKEYSIKIPYSTHDIYIKEMPKDPSGNVAT